MTTESRILRALRVRNFRLFFIGHAISVNGTWMQRVAQDWLVYQLTGDGFAVGVATAMQFLPILLFGLWGGVVVDRADRRVLMVWTQTISGLLAAVLAVLTLAGAVEYWMVLVLCGLLGVVSVVDTPGRQAFVTQLVETRDKVTALGLASTVHNAGRLIGPAIAGVLIGTVGAGAAFAVNAVSFVAVIAGLLMMDPATIRPIRQMAREESRVRDGLRYVVHHAELRSSLILIGVVALFGQNFRVVLPVLAEQAFHGGAEAYGWLTSAMGAGAMLGAVATASGGRMSSRALVLSAVAFGLSNLLLGVSPWLSVALVSSGLVGVSNIVFNTMARTLLQARSPEEMHGRVMSVYSFVSQGTTPIGGPLMGWICDAMGARAGLMVAAATAVVAAVGVVPSLRRHGGHAAPATAVSVPLDPDDEAVVSEA
jgi:MFS family permease